MGNKCIDQVVAEYQAVLRDRQELWQADQRPKPNASQSNIEKITARSLEVLGLDDDIDAFLENLAPGENARNFSLQQTLGLVAKSLRDDLVQCMSDEEIEFFEGFELHFLPTGYTNACCVNCDANGQPLGFFVAFLNEGLFFSLHQLFTALLFEELQGDLSDYRKDGTADFDVAVNLYLNPTENKIKPMAHDVGDKDASGEIGASITSATSLLLQFISLHEFAHAWLGHHDIIATNRLALVTHSTSSSADDRHSQFHDFEYDADEFAWKALMKRTSSPQGQWANFFAVYLFFKFLDALEQRMGRPLSDMHPSPIKRAERLKALLMSALPGDAHLASDLDRIDVMVARWNREKGAKV